MNEIVGKPGYTTTEFWVTVLTVVSFIATSIWGHDWGISANTQQWAPLAAMLAGAIYAVGRSIVKVGTHKAIADQNASVNYSSIAAVDPESNYLDSKFNVASGVRADNNEPSTIDSSGYKR